LSRNGETIELDARPSDALALATRVRAPIFCAEHVVDIAAN
jgi:bifunctional DNase/RNase